MAEYPLVLRFLAVHSVERVSSRSTLVQVLLGKELRAIGGNG
ncbi:MAG: hypothetical protein WA790_17125 [Sulfitobacter sp.]